MSPAFRLDPDCANYAVIGNPIAHSLSPTIHQAFARQCGIEVGYQALLVEVNGLADALSEFQRQGGAGLNITSPFKQEAYEWVRHSSDKAARAGAINTLWFDEKGESHGDTTDGAGLLYDLAHHRISIGGKRLLVLGAGGAVRSVLGDLLAAEPGELMIANRSLARAEALLGLFSDFSSLRVSGYADLKARPYDVIINASAASLHGALPLLPDGILREGGVCYDMSYARQDTPFVCWGRAHGAGIAVDGIGMLVAQAAESFYIWHGLKPQTEAVIAMLKRT